LIERAPNQLALVEVAAAADQNSHLHLTLISIRLLAILAISRTPSLAASEIRHSAGRHTESGFHHRALRRCGWPALRPRPRANTNVNLKS
jgi:hypothetical protein